MPTRWLIIIVTVLLLAVAALGQMHAGIPPMRINATTAADLGMMLLERADGVSVLAVLDGSMADRAGIRPGDMLLQVDDKRILSMEDLNTVLYSHQVGDTVTAIIYRSGKQAAVDLVLAEAKGN